MSVDSRYWPEPPSNPFATRFVRPGAMRYRFPAAESTATLLRRLEKLNWRGQIVGPHGSGKTTLLQSLAPLWRQWGRTPIQVTLHSRQRRLPITATAARRWDTNTQLIIDGYEQLCWTNRAWLLCETYRSGCGLLITSHRSQGWSNVFSTRTTPELASELVRELVPNRDGVSFSETAVSDAFHRNGGNLRETFFCLYELWQQGPSTFAIAARSNSGQCM